MTFVFVIFNKLFHFQMMIFFSDVDRVGKSNTMNCWMKYTIQAAVPILPVMLSVYYPHCCWVKCPTANLKLCDGYLMKAWPQIRKMITWYLSGLEQGATTANTVCQISLLALIHCNSITSVRFVVIHVIQMQKHKISINCIGFHFFFCKLKYISPGHYFQ